MHEIGQTLQLHHYPAEMSQDGSAPWCYRRTTCREQADPYADRMKWLVGLLWGAFGGFAMEALDYIVAVRRWRRLPWNVGANSLAPGHPTGSAHREDPTGELPAPGLVA